MSNINDLPIEVLTRVFDFLSVCERKHASAVCTLWYSILHCARFQRQCQLLLDRTFEEELTDLEKRVLRSCRNLSITHWDDMDDDDYDDEEEEGEQQGKEEIIQLKYLFEPTPEHILTDILFGLELDLESLDLFSTYDSCREIIEDRLPQIPNLRELSLSFEQGRQTANRTPDSSFWIMRHDRLNTLRIKLAYEMKPFQLIAPNLTTLDLQPNCRWNLQIIQTYNQQLQCLKVQFQDSETLDIFMSLAFPCLTHLQVRMFDDKDTQIRYSRTRHRLADAEKEEQFVRGMPRLKKLLLESNLMFFRIGPALAKSAHQLEKLTLEEQQIDYAQLKVVEALPKLKDLILFRCEVLMSPPMLPTLNLPHLDRLKLIYNESSIAFDKGLSGLKSLKVAICTNNNHKVLHKICQNLANLEHLEVLVNAKITNTALRHLHRLTKLKSLKLEDIEPTVRLWAHCPTVPTVRKLVFYNCTMSMATLRPVAKLFPALHELFLDRCYFKCCDETNHSDNDKDGDEDAQNVSLSTEHLRKLFPLCKVSLKELFCPEVF